MLAYAKLHHSYLVRSLSLTPIYGTKYFLSATAEHWDKHQDVNLRGTFLCFKHAALHMIKQGRGGRLIGGASLAAFSGIAMHSAYSASKAGIRALTHSAGELLGQSLINRNLIVCSP